MSDPESGAPRHRLDPDSAAAPRPPDPSGPDGPDGPDGPLEARPRPHRTPPPVINTRPYRIAIGLFALVLVVAFSVYELTTRHAQSPTVAVGHRLHYFAAPLAASTLSGDANLNPTCTLARHDPRALNICLLAQRGPLVLAFFVTGSKTCERVVSTLQTVARELPRTGVAYAAVAIEGSHSAVRAAVRSHHWTVPVAYDADGAVGAAYDVEVCPMLELARRGGVVTDVLIGNHWLRPAALAARVRAIPQG